MSALDELESEGLLTKKQIKEIKRKANLKARKLKLQRKIVDQLARNHFEKYIANGRSWKGLERDRQQFRSYMKQRHALHERIARIVPEKVEPEWDSP